MANVTTRAKAAQLRLDVYAGYAPLVEHEQDALRDISATVRKAGEDIAKTVEAVPGYDMGRMLGSIDALRAAEDAAHTAIKLAAATRVPSK